MRRLAALLFLAPCIALASAYGGADGVNRKGEIIRISGDLAEMLYVQKHPGDDEWAERYEMRIECPSFEAVFLDQATRFSCRKDSTSPLAGTTYRVTTSRRYRPCNIPPFDDPSPGTVYVCVSGCSNPRAPKRFRVSPWEC